MKFVLGTAAAALIASVGASVAFERLPAAPHAGWPGYGRPAAPAFPTMHGRQGPLRHAGALHASRRGALANFAGTWPLWYGPATSGSTRVFVTVNVNQTLPPRLPTVADLPVKPGYVTTPPDAPAFVVLQAPPQPAAAVGTVFRAEGGTARIVELGDGFVIQSAANPRIIEVPR